jgi:hypothetical protein
MQGPVELAPVALEEGLELSLTAHKLSPLIRGEGGKYNLPCYGSEEAGPVIKGHTPPPGPQVELTSFLTPPGHPQSPVHVLPRLAETHIHTIQRDYGEHARSRNRREGEGLLKSWLRMPCRWERGVVSKALGDSMQPLGAAWYLDLTLQTQAREAAPGLKLDPYVTEGGTLGVHSPCQGGDWGPVGRGWQQCGCLARAPASASHLIWGTSPGGHLCPGTQRNKPPSGTLWCA